MLLALSDITREVDRAFWWLTAISLVLLAGVTLVMIAFAIRYRREKTTTTKQIEGHTWLEITWIVIPTIIVTWMFFLGYKGFVLMRTVPKDAMVVQVTGRQWLWSFYYPEEKLNATKMVVPVGQAVKVELTAPPDDVVHSFYIPDFRVKEDAVPGKWTHLWFRAERAGDYNIFCAEFCGKDHSKMITLLRAVSPEEYREWVYAQRAKRFRPLVYDAITDPDAAGFAELGIDGGRLYRTFCVSCHGAAGDGSGLPGVARNFTKPDGWKRSPKVTDIYRTLTEGIPGTQMRAYPNLTPWERVAVAHYVRSLIKWGAPSDTADDYAALVKQYELDKVKPPKQTIPIERAMKLLSRASSRSPKTSAAVRPTSGTLALTAEPSVDPAEAEPQP